MAGYTKLFSRILDSTIWREDDKTRLLWITMLALADQDGVVQCTVPGLADRAKVSLEACEKALERFQSPDKYSWSQEDGGRRIRVVEGGWFLINHDKYRALLSKEDQREKTRLRVKRHRQKNKEGSNASVTLANACNDKHKQIQKQEADTKAEETSHLSERTENQILEIARSNPANAHRQIGNVCPRDQAEVILDAIARDGFDLVIAGTRNLAEAVTQWPPGEHRFIPNILKFYRDSEYLKDPAIWRRDGTQQASTSAASQRTDNNRRNLFEAVRSHVSNRDGLDRAEFKDGTDGGTAS